MSTTTPFVAPIGFTQPGAIPVAHTEGAVAVDLQVFLPDIVNQIMRAQSEGAVTMDELIKSVTRTGYAIAHISCDQADTLAADLIAASLDAEDAAGL